MKDFLEGLARWPKSKPSPELPGSRYRGGRGRHQGTNGGTTNEHHEQFANVCKSPRQKGHLAFESGCRGGKILKAVAGEAAPIADDAAKVATALFPQFAPKISAADNLVTKIAAKAVAVEGTAAATGTQTGTGAQKLESVLLNVGPAINQWVAANFPGAKAVSAAAKAGLVNGVVPS